MAAVAAPLSAKAGLFSAVAGIFGVQAKAASALPQENSQSIDVLQADVNPSHEKPTGGADISIVDNSALVPENSPQSSEDKDTPQRPGSDQISVYVVRDGDTLSEIAQMFNVSVNTILWTNDLKNKTVQPGQVLIILPVTGIKYTVKKGDTVESIAKASGGDATEIRNYNNISGNSALAAGTSIIIPNGEIAAIAAPSSNAKKTSANGASVSSAIARSERSIATGVAAPSAATGDTTGYYMRPLHGGVKTQGIHGYNAVDIGTPIGTTIYAAATGDVIISKDSGWNGGYGNYIAISHPNGTQTLYAHLSSTIVSAGAHVVQGQVIGYSGSTGESTGPHLHFEVRGAVNPF